MHQTTHRSIGALVIDSDAREVTIDGQPVPLTNAEYTLLSTLAESPRRAFSSEHLTHVLTDSEWVNEVHALHVTVSRLRRKLGESGSQPRRVVTVHGYGYRYEPVQAPDLSAAMTSNAQVAPRDSSTLSAFAIMSLDRMILWASDSFTQLLGWQPADLLGTVLYELIHPDDRPHAMAAREDLNAGLPTAFVIHLRTATGEYRHVEALARPIVGPSGETSAFLGEFRIATAAQATALPVPDPIHANQPGRWAPDVDA